ncbi:hypothetical protein [Tolypothrix sp. VBCCA 56010]|uniref:hypothetical protein n=1 Tax=Tolypothrix sp. VBCCA 56010 TaxID=3137731 RepID=UPI003D7F0318
MGRQCRAEVPSVEAPAVMGQGGQGDKETRRQGDKGTRRIILLSPHPPIPPSPCLPPLPPSPHSPSPGGFCKETVMLLA